MPQSTSIHMPAAVRAPRRAAKLFGDLKVRLKLMVLHNLFFAVLIGGVLFRALSLSADQAKTNLFIVLGAIYILAVVLLETTSCRSTLSAVAFSCWMRPSHAARRARARAHR